MKNIFHGSKKQYKVEVQVHEQSFTMEAKTIALVLILLGSFSTGNAAKRNQDNVVSLKKSFSDVSG